jgi:hypothetical protein
MWTVAASYSVSVADTHHARTGIPATHLVIFGPFFRHVPSGHELHFQKSEPAAAGNGSTVFVFIKLVLGSPSPDPGRSPECILGLSPVRRAILGRRQRVRMPTLGRRSSLERRLAWRASARRAWLIQPARALALESANKSLLDNCRQFSSWRRALASVMLVSFSCSFVVSGGSARARRSA